jgi:FMN-dependent NADH-azoreductase
MAVQLRIEAWSASVSDKLTDELLASDLLVIATPTWNVSIPSSLKAWIDLVVRPGKTFSYTNDGVLGLAKGKKETLQEQIIRCLTITA